MSHILQYFRYSCQSSELIFHSISLRIFIFLVILIPTYPYNLYGILKQFLRRTSVPHSKQSPTPINSASSHKIAVLRFRFVRFHYLCFHWLLRSHSFTLSLAFIHCFFSHLSVCDVRLVALPTLKCVLFFFMFHFVKQISKSLFACLFVL